MAKDLMGAVQFPNDIRLEVLQAMQRRLGSDATLALFSQFIGMANSVVANCHEALEVFLIVEKGWHPHEAEKLNFPTLFGALNGIKLAQGVNQQKTCHGCACRLGSLANQSPATTCDVDYCLAGDDKFWCHEELNDDGTPTKRCIGFQTHLKKRETA
ncbi:hypothetical protein FRUB_10623 [Fimbriiglobus ruber]|uniref:Uncharacterized protein n=1 Tax=Fimbriiglobus ruber TaxID=1908690 RepID=A0A225CZG5_9BACT|nr:hypothetical protein FRUB_10623 [Fimbriiglobus ruber]